MTQRGKMTDLELEMWEYYRGDGTLPEWPSAARHIITGISKADRDEYDTMRCSPVYLIDGEWSWCNSGCGRGGHINGGFPFRGRQDPAQCAFCTAEFPIDDTFTVPCTKESFIRFGGEI